MFFYKENQEECEHYWEVKVDDDEMD